jgi:hypothetical protein
MLLCPCPLHDALLVRNFNLAFVDLQWATGGVVRHNKGRKEKSVHAARKGHSLLQPDTPRDTRHAVSSETQAGGESVAREASGVGAACLGQHVGCGGAVDGAADGLAGTQDLPHGALQLAGHAARAHDARNGDHVVQRQVAVVRDVLHLQWRKRVGEMAQQLGSPQPRLRGGSRPRRGAARRAAPPLGFRAC